MITPEQLAAPDTEHAHQCALMCWVALNTPTNPDLAGLFAIPNGGERNPAVAARLRAEGVRAGVPDLFLPLARETQTRSKSGDTVVIRVERFNGLFIEMKKPKTGKLSPGQLACHNLLTQRGYKVVTCWGWQEARDTLLWYLGAAH